MVKKIGENLIVDNAQAYFSERISGIRTIYSPRKFVGIQDGGIAYTKGHSDMMKYPKDKSYDRCSHLLRRYDAPASDGYQDFKKNDAVLDNAKICRISNLTIALLRNIDF